MSRRALDKRQRARARNQRRADARAANRFSAPILQRSTAADPTMGVEAPRIYHHLSWYMARLQPRMGEKAIKALDDKLVCTVSPRVSEIVTRSGRRLVRSRQLLVRTVFVGVDDTDHLEMVQDTRGVAEIVSVPHLDDTATGNVEGWVMRPARLNPDVLQRFVDALARDEIVQPYGVAEGDSVIIRTGSFASFPAVVEQILPNEMVKVGVSIFGRETPMELPIADVECVN